MGVSLFVLLIIGCMFFRILDMDIPDQLFTNVRPDPARDIASYDHGPDLQPGSHPRRLREPQAPRVPARLGLLHKLLSKSSLRRPSALLSARHSSDTNQK